MIKFTRLRNPTPSRTPSIRVKPLKKPSYLEGAFEDMLKRNKINYIREHKFHPIRKWRFDFAIPEFFIAVECEGAVWSGGRHTRGSGYSKDCEKYNNATLLGWRVLRYCAIKDFKDFPIHYKGLVNKERDKNGTS